MRRVVRNLLGDPLIRSYLGACGWLLSIVALVTVALLVGYLDLRGVR